MSELSIETSGDSVSEPCTCCDDRSRKVWGYVHLGENTEAAYFVHWTLGKVDEHGAHVDLIIGPWGELSLREDRCAVSLEFRRTESGPSFMVIDASARPIASSNLVGKALDRSDVIGTPLATKTFAFVDAIWLQDQRISEITGEPADPAPPGV